MNFEISAQIEDMLIQGSGVVISVYLPFYKKNWVATARFNSLKNQFHFFLSLSLSIASRLEVERN